MDLYTPLLFHWARQRGCPPSDAPDLVQEVLVTLVQKIRARAYTVTDADLDALRGRYTDDQLFEIVLAAAFGAASDRLSAAHQALEDA